MTGGQQTGESPDVTVRPLRTLEDYEQCVALQRATWGEDFTEIVPPSILMVSQKVGGVTAGAFDSEGRLVGFVFGISGIRQGRLVHWSDMLAVHPESAGRGIGRRLKVYQRERLLGLGIEIALWTVDPLEAVNAHFNINRLGARPTEYIPDMYGADTGSALHAGIGTDRFMIEWNLTDPRVEQALAGRLEVDTALLAQSQVVNSDIFEGAPQPVAGDLPELPSVRVEIPHNIQHVKAKSLELALLWRSTTRRAFLRYLESGYSVEGFRLDTGTNRCFYLLTRANP